MQASVQHLFSEATIRAHAAFLFNQTSIITYYYILYYIIIMYYEVIMVSLLHCLSLLGL